jgi:hypothetical protein
MGNVGKKIDNRSYQMQLVSEQAKWRNEAKVLIDEKTIKALKELGVVKGLSYIYFAIEIERAENPDSKKLEIDLVDFADRWNLRTIEVQKAMIDLDSKGVTFITNSPKIIQLSLSFVPADKSTN